MLTLVDIVVDAPRLGPLTYIWPEGLPRPSPGEWALVPVGRRQMIGLIHETRRCKPQALDGIGYTVREVQARVEAIPTITDLHLGLLRFAARYYHRGLGEVVGTMLPGWWRAPTQYRKSPKRKHSPAETLAIEVRNDAQRKGAPSTETYRPKPHVHPLTSDQQTALKTLLAEARPAMLHGATGSGKTRVYEEIIAELGRDRPGRILVLVPEIGLTPQLHARLQERFPQSRLGMLHSGLTERQRAKTWIEAATGCLDILIGTRMAVFVPIDDVRLIIVDEEHDNSYKQQEGLRYSARDLAIWRAQSIGARLILGSATPSLETQAQVRSGRIRSVEMRLQATGTQTAQVHLIDLSRERPQEGLAPSLWSRMEATLSGGQQSLVFVNRRGWSPVVSCGACGWINRCRDCDASAVLHQRGSGWRLICHRCGRVEAPPKACPACGNPSLDTLGRGSQRIEEAITRRFPEARVLRVDRDQMTSPKATEAAFDAIRKGQVDIVVGTQMMAKGHDFPNLRTVLVVDADARLHQPDYRGPEQLFALLLQVAGRAGRHPSSSPVENDQAQSVQAGVWIQTHYPEHPLMRAITAPGFDSQKAFWSALLADREQAGLPPYRHLALVRLSHRDAAVVEDAAKAIHRQGNTSRGVRLYPPVPQYPERVANKIRWQVLLESESRSQLHAAVAELDAWMATSTKVDTSIEIDPLGFSG
ncbi:MAG: hypothetical protein RL617_1058 [Pseudomonadota bacterium]